MKPVEFKLEEAEENHNCILMTFFYDDGKKFDIYLRKDQKPEGFILGRHYFIGDLYGYKVNDDRRGL